MANRVRGVRQSVPANILLGRLNGPGGPVHALTLTSIANAIIQGGAIPLPGGGGFITAVDGDFTVTGGTLSLHTIVAGNLIANSTGSTAEPTSTTLTALIDQALGNAQGDLLYRDSSVWKVLAPGTSGQFLKTLGASANPAWATVSAGLTLNARGTWGASVGYNPGDVAIFGGSAYLNYVAVAAPAATAQQWVDTSSGGTTISTTNTTNDTATAASGNGNCTGNLGKSSGKWYYEFVCTNMANNGDQMSVAVSAGVLTQDMAAQFNGQITGSQAGHGTGSFAGIQNTKRGAIALDIGGGLFWVCEDVTAGSPNWNGSSANSPGAGTGGVAIGSMSTPLFPAFYIQTPLSQKSILFTAGASFLGSVPSGFSPWSTPAGSNTSPDLDDTHWLSQGAIVVGTTEVGGGTTGRLLYDNAGVVGEAIVGSGLSLSGGTLSSTGSTPNFAPGGRLSLTSAVAVQTADVSGGTTIYYVPFVNDYIPVLGLTIGTGVSIALDSSSGHTGYQQSGKNFDLFLVSDSGTLRLGTGPAWTNDTTRANAIDQTTVAGIWTNTGTITVRWGSSSGNTLSATAGTAVYVGTMRASADGQCTVQFNKAATAGGGAPVVGLYNAYNRVRGFSNCYDNTATWTYTSTTWRTLDASSNNRVSFIDGLGQSNIISVLGGLVVPGGAGFKLGVNLDSTSATPTGISSVSSGTSAINNIANLYPGLGFHYIQEMEANGDNSATSTNIGGSGGQQNYLTVILEI